MLVLVAPGQGAQTPGFLTPWLDLPGAADRLRSWSDAAELDLLHYGTEGSAEEIRDTAVAQPLLVAGALVSAGALFGEVGPHVPGPAPDVVAGHSVGELAAAVLAGVLSAEDAMRLVRRRSLAMAESARATDTGMIAVLGGDQAEVLDHLAGLGLTAANINGAGQIVAAGTADQLAALRADKAPGTRVIALKVAGAFHTEHMAPAVSALYEAINEVQATDPSIRYVSNADGESVASGAEIMRRLVLQVSNPVRWDLCMETFQRLGVTAIVELCPAGALTGLAKRAMEGVATLAVKSPDQLDAARELVAEHAVGPLDTAE